VPSNNKAGIKMDNFKRLGRSYNNGKETAPSKANLNLTTLMQGTTRNTMLDIDKNS
jgi:hypothetical protein